jgi:protein O-GlcNAc transferase
MAITDTKNPVLQGARRLFEAGRSAEAEDQCRQALRVDPSDPHVLQLLAVINLQSGRFQIANVLIRKALTIDPLVPRFHNSLGLILLSQGDPDQAIEAFREALRINPGYAIARSNLLWALHFTSSCDRATLLAEARAWGDYHAEPLRHTHYPHVNSAACNRRLRIGYVSADLRHHPVGYFMESVLSSHDPSQVEVFCYANSAQVDDLTMRLRAASHHWRDVVGLADDETVTRIRRDQIDILIDLSGHTAGNRLAVFAHKPAPVQATWMGYLDTTGVPAVDYLIADPRVCPVGDEEYYVENIVRLPQVSQCFTPQHDLDVAPLPAASRRRVTFGCLNSVPKIGMPVAAIWAEILQAVPGSCLFLKDSALDDMGVRQRVRRAFAAHGISPERILTAGRSAHQDHLAAYAGVDIALDPFPFNGCTSTAEALWMGVPVVSLVGERFSSRVGLSFLSAVGLPELAATSADEYVNAAVTLASDLDSLARLREGLRSRVAQSPLCDGLRFTRNLEIAYREMWRRWCGRQPLGVREALSRQPTCALTYPLDGRMHATG